MAEDRGTHASGSYRISDEAAAARREHERLRALARVLDPHTRRLLEERGLRPGWHCLEVGAGAGTVSTWLAGRVAPGGSVLSTDVDLRFHEPAVPGLEVRQHDVLNDPLPDAHFHLAHARGVLQHIPERGRALARMVAALRPGGWVLIEDADFAPLEGEGVPEPFRTVAAAMTELSIKARQWDRYFGRKLLGLLAGLGLEEVRAEGIVWTMRGGTDEAEWYVLAMEYAGPLLVAAGLADAETVARALKQARDPGFAVLSPIAVATWGRRPAA